MSWRGRGEHSDEWEALCWVSTALLGLFIAKDALKENVIYP